MKDSNGCVVVGFGEALWDVLPGGRKLGGAPANFAFHASQCGLEGHVVSAIGRDALGEEIVEEFRQKDLRFILEEVDYPTGTVEVTLGENGLPEYDIRKDVAWDNLAPTAAILDLARRTSAVCFGSLAQRSPVTRDCLYAFLDAMPADGRRYRVFDVNLRQDFYSHDILCESLRRCNVLKINDEELVIVSRMFGYPGIDLEEKCRHLLEAYNLQALILTCGVNGSYIFSPDQVSFQPTPRVAVVDTVGAGDSFSAVCVASLMRGLPLETAHRNAAAVAAYVCTQPGAMPELPEDLRRDLKLGEGACHA